MGFQAKRINFFDVISKTLNICGLSPGVLLVLGERSILRNHKVTRNQMPKD